MGEEIKTIAPLIRDKKKAGDKDHRKKNDALLKGAVEEFFPYVLRFFYHNADEIFDMAKCFDWMSTELHEIQPLISQKGGSRAADLLVKVHLKNDSTELFLLHLEIQKATNKEFPNRVFHYWYRLTDKYRTAVVSLAVFTGLKSQLQPDQYNFNLLGTEINFKYNTYQIFNHTEEELLKMDNPFALVVLAAQQEAVYSKTVQGGLLKARVRIVRALKASKKFDDEKINSFLHFMDQLIPLTDKKLKRIFDKEISKLFGGKITMGIMEVVREQILDEGIEKGEANKSFEFVARLIEKTGFSDEQIADIANVSVVYIKEVRKELTSRK